MRALFQTLGNKRYLHDLEKLLNDRLTELTPFEDETLAMLGRDLLDLR